MSEDRVLTGAEAKDMMLLSSLQTMREMIKLLDDRTNKLIQIAEAQGKINDSNNEAIGSILNTIESLRLATESGTRTFDIINKTMGLLRERIDAIEDRTKDIQDAN